MLGATLRDDAVASPRSGENRSSRLGLDRTAIRPARLPAGHPPILLVVIDTEEEFDWSSPFDRSSRSVSAIAGLLPVQRMFTELGVRPTYVIDYPVAATPMSADMLAGFAADGSAEIGAHLHPWVTPPEDEAVTAFNSYGGNLDAQVERAKLESLVDAIHRGTGVRPVTFKAGRYGIAPRTVPTIADLGFRIDLSTSPAFNWSGDGGPDYRDYSNDPYWIPAGTSEILEIPTTGGYFGPLRAAAAAFAPVDNARPRKESPVSVYLRKLRLSRRAMLTPEGFKLWELKSLAEALLERGTNVLTLSFHSPSVHVGHTPFVRSPADLEAFVGTIRSFANWFATRHRGRFATASETLALISGA